MGLTSKLKTYTYSILFIKSIPFDLLRAEVAELVDALGSGSSEGSLVGVRVSPSAPLKTCIGRPDGAGLCFVETLQRCNNTVMVTESAHPFIRDGSHSAMRR